MVHLSDVILWLFSALGAVTAVVQIWKWVRGRRAERGFERFMESYADQEDAEAIRSELRRLERTLQDLRVTAPEVAKRMHLEQRRRDLSSILGGTWDEYCDISAKLAEPDPAGELPTNLVEALRTEIEPRYRLEQRGRRRTTFLLVVMAAALLLPAPFTPQSLLYLVAGLMFAVATLPSEIGNAALACGLTMTCIGIASGYLIGTWLVKTKRARLPKRPAIVSSIAIMAAVLFGNGLSIWIVWNSLGYPYHGDYPIVAGLNALNLGLAAVGACCVTLAGLRPWLPVRWVVVKGGL